MGIMVFLPDCTSTDPEQIKERGGGDLLDPSIDAVGINVVKGPGGKSGVLFTFWPFHDPRSYYAATQTWLEAPPDGDLPKGRYWLGYVTAQRPTPEMLQRRKLIEGENIVLEDNRVWKIPCCEYAPKRITRDADGDEIEVVKDSHREWVETSNIIHGLIMAQGYGTVTEPDYVIEIPGGMRYAAQSLGKNYRVNPDVVDLLGLLDKENMSELILAACGITQLARLVNQKKSTETLSQQPVLS